MVMPLIGLEELPIRPLMREATVTKRKPKTTTKIAARKSEKPLVMAPGIGLNFSKAHIMATMMAEPTTTTRMDMSRSVRFMAERPTCLARMSFSPALSAEKIVGSVLIRVIKPEAATAPAPMGRM